MKEVDPLLRRLDADNRGVGGFVTLSVRACRLPERRDVAQHIEQIILNLKRQADGRCEFI